MSDRKIRIAFDIGGVLSKYPHILLPVFRQLQYSHRTEVFVISDMHDKTKIQQMLWENGFELGTNYIHSADYVTYGENCKAVLCEQLGIDILIDDFPGYVCTPGKPLVRLLVMPDPALPYYGTADDPEDPTHWKTDGSEGNFGRRNPSCSKRPPEK